MYSGTNILGILLATYTLPTTTFVGTVTSLDERFHRQIPTLQEPALILVYVIVATTLSKKNWSPLAVQQLHGFPKCVLLF